MTSLAPLERIRTDQRLVSYGAALALAVACIAWMFSPMFLLGRAQIFQQGDASQHVSGWLFFAKDAWHWPLLKTTLLNAPQGVSIIFTDSIPIAAFLLKPLAHWLPDGFHYFGLWYVLVFVTQALSTVFVMRMIGVRGVWPILIAVGFALLWHPLLRRIGQTSLTTHALILMALGLYFGAHNGRVRPAVALGGMCALVWLSAWIHAYFTAMLLPFLLLLALVLVYDRRLSARHTLLAVSGALAALTVIFWTGGYFAGGSNFQDSGFGAYSLNLLSPFCSGMMCPNVDATGGQTLEGGVYLGTGTIALLVVALTCCTRQVFHALRTHWMLVILMLLFTAYAMSSSIYWGNHLLVRVELPEAASRITSIFRASGRFFWPVSYVLLFASLALILQERKPIFGFVAIVALGLQFWELSVRLQQLRAMSHDPARPPLVNQKVLLDGMERVVLYPFFGCARNDTLAYLPYMRGAADRGLPINTGYVSRAQYACDAMPQELRTKDDDTLHVLLDPAKAGDPLPPVFAERAVAGQCAVIAGDVVCRSDFDTERWRSVAPGFVIPRNLDDAVRIADMQRRPAECRLSQAEPVAGDVQEISFGGRGTSQGCRFLGTGWHDAETWGAWSNQRAAQILLPPRQAPTRIELRMSVFTGGTGLRKVTFRLGPRILGEAMLSDQAQWHAIILPADGAPLPQALVLELDSITSPSKAGVSSDPRLLGVGLHVMRWSAASP